MTDKKICVYAICKNESKFISQWLDNMSEADYIVVLDTGSTDGTYEKLKEENELLMKENLKLIMKLNTMNKLKEANYLMKA